MTLPASFRSTRLILGGMALSAAVLSTRPAAAQRAVERTRWEYGEFEWVRDLDNKTDAARWTVGDSTILSTKSLDNLVELVAKRRLPREHTQHTLFAWLGEQGWEMVSCTQTPGDATLRTFAMACWFKRPRV
jgi:hypothetical protein